MERCLLALDIVKISFRSRYLPIQCRADGEGFWLLFPAVGLHRQKHEVFRMSFQASGPKIFCTWTRQSDFDFFPVRDIPLRFISLNLFFSAAVGQIHSTFVQTIRRVHHVSYHGHLIICSATENFFQRVNRIKIFFSYFLEGQIYIFKSCPCSKIGNSNLLH